MLYVDTDAPVPSNDPSAIAALFDRVRVDVVPPGASDACEKCSHDFGLADAILASGSASVGIRYPPGESGWTVRLRLYWSPFAASGGEPDPDATIDRTFTLPVLAADGIVELTALLSTDDVASGPGDVPSDPAPGRPRASAIGTWQGAQREPCAGDAQPGEVCVPGGAYWLGTSQTPPVVGSVPLPPRIVVLSPFWIDDREVTVGAYRSFDPSRPLPWSGSHQGNSPVDWCTFTVSAGSHESDPLDCVGWVNARAYCQSRGGDLPTEAQQEYLSGGLRGTSFPWGTDPPTCDGAVWGRAGYGGLSLEHACPEAAPEQAPLPVPKAGRTLDALGLDTGVVYDLAGNLAEWSLDAWQAPDGPCWTVPGVRNDPVCVSSSATNRSVRGGNWAEAAVYLVARERVSMLASGNSPMIGFRCARRASTP